MAFSSPAHRSPVFGPARADAVVDYRAWGIAVDEMVTARQLVMRSTYQSVLG
jgi:hypothetical protein